MSRRPTCDEDINDDGPTFARATQQQQQQQGPIMKISIPALSTAQNNAPTKSSLLSDDNVIAFKEDVEIDLGEEEATYNNNHISSQTAMPGKKHVSKSKLVGNAVKECMRRQHCK